MKGLGWVVLIVGVIWTLVAINMDVSVATGYGTRVNNIGLMASKQNHIILGAFIILCGLLMAIFGSRNTPVESSQVKCPFCAELISNEAVKCKHCGSDVIRKKTVKSVLWIPSSYYSVEDGEARLKREAVADLVTDIKNKNPHESPVKLISKYQQGVISLKRSLPPGIQDAFMKSFKEFM